MKKTIALLTIPAMLLVSSFSFANSDNDSGHKCGQGKHSDNGKHDKNNAKHSEKRLNRLAKKLDLNEDQQTKIKALFDARQGMKTAGTDSRKALHDSIRTLDPSAADYSTKLAAVKKQAGLQAQGKIDKMMSMRQSMQAILTPEQFKKMQDMKMNHDKQGKGKHSN